MPRKAYNLLPTLAAMALALIAAGCARMGQPDGGWFDDTPPQIISSTPADKATGVKGRRVTINFNEFIKIDDVTNKVVVSPPQMETPEIKSAGKKIVVDLKDSLKAGLTYTIDFSDAITDNNEGNPMGNYTFSFSTGERIDTFEVAGNVLDASNLEPVKGILVGLHSNPADSAFTTLPLQRVARTDSRGRFVIKGVAPGTYRVYALQDADGNYLFSQKSEMLAFSRNTYTPTHKPDIRQDTVWRDTLRIDSIIRTGYTHFYPDDIVLMAFTHPQTDRFLIKTERQDHRKIGFYFSYGSDSLPALRGLNFNADRAFVVEPSERKDTVTYWLRDTALINRDSLLIEATYMATDSTGQLALRTDTIEAIPKMAYEKRMKMELKEREDWHKEQEKRKKREQPYDSIMPRPKLAPKIKVPSGMSPDQNITIEMPTPLARLDTAAIHLYSKIDTVWYRAQVELHTVENKLRTYRIMAEWRPGAEYSLEIDSAAFCDIYGAVNDALKTGVKVRSNDEFSSLRVNLTGAPDSVLACLVVELLGQSDEAVKTARADGGTADFYYITPGTYYLRAFADTNLNGKWDTGDYQSGRQPEQVFYCPKKVVCKAKWDVTTPWNITATPPARQKPLEITKQKPDAERKLRNRNANRARDLGITYKR